MVTIQKPTLLFEVWEYITYSKIKQINTCFAKFSALVYFLPSAFFISIIREKWFIFEGGKKEHLSSGFEVRLSAFKFCFYFE